MHVQISSSIHLLLCIAPHIYTDDDDDQEYGGCIGKRKFLPIYIFYKDSYGDDEDMDGMTGTFVYRKIKFTSIFLPSLRVCE